MRWVYLIARCVVIITLFIYAIQGTGRPDFQSHALGVLCIGVAYLLVDHLDQRDEV